LSERTRKKGKAFPGKSILFIFQGVGAQEKADLGKKKGEGGAAIRGKSGVRKKKANGRKKAN